MQMMSFGPYRNKSALCLSRKDRSYGLSALFLFQCKIAKACHYCQAGGLPASAAADLVIRFFKRCVVGEGIQKEFCRMFKVILYTACTGSFFACPCCSIFYFRHENLFCIFCAILVVLSYVWHDMHPSYTDVYVLSICGRRTSLLSDSYCKKI